MEIHQLPTLLIDYTHVKFIGKALFIKIGRRNALQCTPIHVKLLKLYGDDALSYSEVYVVGRQFLMGREYVNDARKTGWPRF
jgi:hypothetical protein